MRRDDYRAHRKTQYAAAHSLHASSDLHTAMREIAKEKVGRLYTSSMLTSVTRNVEEVLSDLFQADFDLPEDELKNNCYVLIENLFSGTAHNRALDHSSKQGVGRLAESSVFIDFFAGRALAFFRSILLWLSLLLNS